MTAREPRGRRSRTTQRILDGAAAAFAKGGYAATSMEEIAAASGVSKLLLYRDFAGKKELYQAVLERTLERIERDVPREGSNEALRLLIAAARADADGFTLLYRHAAREPEFAAYVADRHARDVEDATEIMRRVEPDPVLRRWAAETAVNMTYQAIIAWLEHGDPARDDEFHARLLDINRAVAKAQARPPTNVNDRPPTNAHDDPPKKAQARPEANARHRPAAEAEAEHRPAGGTR